MQVHWYTVIAQVINFFILLFLLKRFLYRPVIDAMERRQKHIRDSIQTAEEKTVEAACQLKSYQAKNVELDEMRQLLVHDMQQEVQQQRQVLMSQLRAEADALGLSWRDDVERGKNEFLLELRRSLGMKTTEIVRKVLRDMADVELENQIVAKFLRQFHLLPDLEKKRLQGAQVQTSFVLNTKQRQAVIEALTKTSPENSVVNFIINTDLICGIAAHSSSYSLSWTFADYMDEFDGHVMESLAGSDSEIK